MNPTTPTDTVDVEIRLNGDDRRATVPARYLLSDLIRDVLGAKGTNIGCEHGYCGACTVSVDGLTTRSCLTLAATASGSVVETVESLATDGRLNILQQAFVAEHGLQCGYCTPGILMTVSELIADNPHPTEEEVRSALAGNICRCTGYVHIVAAVMRAVGANAPDGMEKSS
ncbi:MAG: 2Fe-2S iron-sulfur cluster binding domain-containing protein [Acidimicrobiia bacterium]|nr:2Fe-2S iron-sulfur cluster binding domain-containing protein [Acidimicrobiia bacterium]